MNESPGMQLAAGGNAGAAPLATAVVLPSFDARPRWKTFLPLVLLFVFFNAVPAVSRVAGFEPGDFFQKAAVRWQVWLIASWTAEATLLATWLALAPVSVCERLALTGLTYVVWQLSALLGLMAMYWLGHVEPPLIFIKSFVELSYFASLAAALGAFRYFRGWQLTGPDWSGNLPPGRILRFGLLQFLAMITALAAYMAVCRAASLTLVAAVSLGSGLLAAPVVVSTLWLVLATPRNRQATLVALVVLAAASVMVIMLANYPATPRGPNVAILVLAWYVMLLVSVVWFRVGAWRLTHEGSPARLVSQPSDNA
jgi:hypothetical protein